jgi:ABC-type dipeptide/oligopeptide/nickel transport system ATPase subunit
VHAVDGISFGIAEREVLGLVGESGSGKSTLGKTLLGLYDKTAGSVHYRGEPLPAHYQAADFRRLSRRMQMIFQDPYSSLNPRMTVGEILAEGPLLHRLLTAPQARDKAAQWLERVGLHADHLSRYPHEFSGGQRQRIGIARALILEPEFVVCDEPISALDVSVQAQVVNLLNELKQTMGLTMIVHRPRPVDGALCQRPHGGDVSGPPRLRLSGAPPRAHAVAADGPRWSAWCRQGRESRPAIRSASSRCAAVRCDRSARHRPVRHHENRSVQAGCPAPRHWE